MPEETVSNHPPNQNENSNLIPSKVVDISLSTFGFVIFLKNIYEEQTLPIFIGVPEAQAIAVHFNKVKTPRPLTHDLFKTMLTLMDCRVDKIVISDLIDNTFYAKIFFHTESKHSEPKQFVVDSRPSDAIALALHFDATIYIEKDVLIEGAILIKEELGQDHPPSEESTLKSLHESLKRAIAEERYEDAARIRDEIKKFTDGN